MLVTGVRHDFDLVQGWKTHLQFGARDKLGGCRSATSRAPRAGALLPAVNGLQIGMVASNEDPDGEHRVRVRLPLVDAEEDGVWARVASLDAGAERGFFFRPEIGDEVVVGFLEDDPRRAVVLGMLHSSAKAAPLAGLGRQPREGLPEPLGDAAVLQRRQEGRAAGDAGGQQLTLSEDDQGIKLEDQNGNKIEMTPDGIKIESAKALELKAGERAEGEGTAGRRAELERLDHQGEGRDQVQINS